MILAPRPPFRASGRPPGPGIRGSSRNIAQRFPRILGFPGFWDCWVLRAAPRATVQGVPGKEFRRKHSSVPVSGAPPWNPSEALPCESPGWPPGGQPAPGQSPPRLAPRTIYGNMLHLSDWHRKVRPQSSWWPSAGRTTRKTFSRDWKKSIEEISPREWEKFQERHPETISIGKRERGAEPG